MINQKYIKMKNFIVKNKSVIIAVLMVAGMAILGFGLDWEQSQKIWKADVSGWLIAIGGTAFGTGFIWLCTASNKK